MRNMHGRRDSRMIRGGCRFAVQHESIYVAYLQPRVFKRRQSVALVEYQIVLRDVSTDENIEGLCLHGSEIRRRQPHQAGSNVDVITVFVVEHRFLESKLIPPVTYFPFFPQYRAMKTKRRNCRADQFYGRRAEFGSISKPVQKLDNDLRLTIE